MENLNETKKTKVAKDNNVLEEKSNETVTMTKDELSSLMKKIAEEAILNYSKSQSISDDMISYREKPNKFVELLYLNRVSSDNITYLDNNKLYFVRQLGDRIVMPFDVLQSSNEARDRIKSRKLIVLSGLTEYERKLFGCDYKDGEVLTIEFINNLLELPLNDVVDTFSSLCLQHRRLVAEILRDKYQNDDISISGELVRALLKVAKKDNKLPAEYKYDEKILKELLVKIEERE